MTVVRHAGLAAALCALALGTGCAAVQANRRAPGTVANGTFTPGRAGSAQFGPNPALLCPTGGAFPILAADAAELARDAKRPVPQGDGRLCAVADALLGWNDPGTPPESVMSFLAWHYGLPAAPTRVLVATLETEDPRILAQRLLDPVNAFGGTALAPRFGVVTSREKKGFTKTVVVLYDALAELEPLARRVEGGQVPVRGRLAAGLGKPKLSACDAAGSLQNVAAGNGPDFQADLACGAKPGMLLVEVRADRDGEAVSVARFPVMCGADLPASVKVPPPPPKGGEIAAGADRAVFDLVNGERSAAGVPPLQWDPGVAQVAKAASEATRDESRSASTSNTINFDVVGQLRKAEVVSPLVLLNPAASRTPEEAHWRLAHSPLHRSNMLNPQATHGGVGLATLTDPNAGSIYFVTQLLVRELGAVDAEALRGKLRDAVAKKRADARAEEVKSDPMLEEVAQKYATAMAAARGDLPKAQGDAIVAPLYRPFRNVNIMGGAKTEPLEFAEEGGAAAPGKAMGIGVAQGMNPVLGKNAVYVVILIGTRR
jgi:uncharacterized protein YkwD